MMSRAVVGNQRLASTLARGRLTAAVLSGGNNSQTVERADSTQQLSTPPPRKQRRSSPATRPAGQAAASTALGALAQPPPPPPPAAASSGSPAEPSEEPLGDAASGTAAARSPGAAAPASGATQLAWNDFSRLFKGSGLNSSEISAAWQEYKATGELPSSTLPQEAAEPDPSGSRRRPLWPALPTPADGTQWLGWNDFQRAFSGLGRDSSEISAAYKYYKKTGQLPSSPLQEPLAQEPLALKQDAPGSRRRPVAPALPTPVEGAERLSWNEFSQAFAGWGRDSSEIAAAYRVYKETGQVPKYTPTGTDELRSRRKPLPPALPAPADGAERLDWNSFLCRFKGLGYTSSEIAAAYREYKEAGQLPATRRS